MAATDNFKVKVVYFIGYMGALAFLVGVFFEFIYGSYSPTVPDEAAGQVYIACYKGVKIYLTLTVYILIRVLPLAGLYTALMMAMIVRNINNKK